MGSFLLLFPVMGILLTPTSIYADIFHYEVLSLPLHSKGLQTLNLIFSFCLENEWGVRITGKNLHLPSVLNCFFQMSEGGMGRERELLRRRIQGGAKVGLQLRNGARRGDALMEAAEASTGAGAASSQNN